MTSKGGIDSNENLVRRVKRRKPAKNINKKLTDNKKMWKWGLKRWLKSLKYVPLFHQTRVWAPVSVYRDLQLPVTATPGGSCEHYPTITTIK